MIKYLIFILCFQIYASEKKELIFERKWVQNTHQNLYVGNRLAHLASPLFYKGYVVYGNSLDNISVYNSKTGHPLWTKKIDNGAQSGYVVQGDRLYFGSSSGQYYCVNFYTGQNIWTFPTRAENLSKALLHNNVVYFLSGNSLLYALDADTGKQIWIYTRSTTSDLSIRGGSTPVVHKDTLLVGFSDGFLVALHKDKGSLVWERQINQGLKFKDIDSSPVIDEDSIYVNSFDFAIYRLSIEDGQVVWRIPTGGASTVQLLNHKLFASTSDGKLLSIKKKTGEIIWQNSFNKNISSEPLLYKDILFYGSTDGYLNAVNSETGKLLNKYLAGSSILSKAEIDPTDNYIFIGSSQGNLHAIYFEWKFNHNSEFPLKRKWWTTKRGSH